MVPIDEPAAALDMLLRFLDIDPTISAGPTAQIPSHIGKADQGSVLGALAPNGTLIVDPVDETKSVFHSGEGLADDKKAELDQMREAYYGPRRTTTLVLVLLVIMLGIWAIMRLRRGRRKPASSNGYGRVGRDGLMPMKLRGDLGKHGRRKKSRKSSGDPERRQAKARLLDPAAENADEEHDLEAGRRRSTATADGFSAAEEDPDLAGDIALSPTKKKKQSLSFSKGEGVSRVLFDRDEA